MEAYLVKSGDNLWNIAKSKLGRGDQWPRLWRYNNRREIVKITGRGIPDPDLIYPGQTLLIPTLPGLEDLSAARADSSAPAPMIFLTAPSASPRTTPSAGPTKSPTTTPPAPAGSGPLFQQLPTLKSPFAVKYKLDDIVFPAVVTPEITIEYKMTGDIALLSKNPVAATYVIQSGEIERKLTTEANTAFSKLINEFTFNFNPKTNALSLKPCSSRRGIFRAQQPPRLAW